MDGFAQCLALIPGTSRSGITISMALFCGLTRQAASKFSFLLSIPIIAGSGLLQGIALFSDSALGEFDLLMCLWLSVWPCLLRCCASTRF